MAAYSVALIIIFAALVVGHATSAACGVRLPSPAVGLAALIAVAAVGVRLPGRGLTAFAVLAVAVLVAAVAIVRRREFAWSLVLQGLGTAALALVVGTIPFLAAGTVGILGVSLNNDTSVHLVWAEGLRSPSMASLYPTNPGYPLGPHALMATLAAGTGVDMDRTLTGLVVAIPVLLALQALRALRDVPWFLAVPAAVATAFAYLASAWYGQSAFKEPLMMLFLLGFALALGELLAKPGPRRAVPPALLFAASLLTYSYLAIAWFGLTAAICIALAIVHRRPRRSDLRAGLRL